MARVLHLVGSAVDDFFCDLSRLYAADCLEATAGSHDSLVAYVTPDGAWRFPADLGPTAIAAATPMSLAAAVAVVAGAGVDVMVPQMFCPPGMTHHRALFDLLGVPYLGNPPDVMALGADKAKARAVVAAAGVAVPAGEVVRPGERPAVGLPAVVKPVDADNSVGVTLVRDPGEMEAALKEAHRHSAAALVEEFVPLGREVRCGVVDRGGLRCLPLEEYAMDPDDKPVRLAADKLARDPGGDLRLVAKDPSRAWIVDPGDPVTEVVQQAALACYRALGCRHYGLFDFRIDPQGRPWFLEAGLYCSFARASVVATMAEAAGIGVAELFDDLVAAVLC
ncbi:D-alanine--D-alanine ligase family protein [Pseudonocardia pini]|uniref:D-alanine--D-alanine ligase family protein n=1 Tax=Pseudonocardia pini TaxID=2758030 RepID=UPI0015F07C73|nr:D-alanine--D-alanine ligase [Pseudonocardia pini]